MPYLVTSHYFDSEPNWFAEAVCTDYDDAFHEAEHANWESGGKRGAGIWSYNAEKHKFKLIVYLPSSLGHRTLREDAPFIAKNFIGELAIWSWKEHGYITEQANQQICEFIERFAAKEQ